MNVLEGILSPSLMMNVLSRQRKKVKHTIWMDYNGVALLEFLPKGQNENKIYYLGVMRRRRKVFCQRPRICGLTTREFAPWWTNTFFFLNKNNTNTIQQPPLIHENVRNTSKQPKGNNRKIEGPGKEKERKERKRRKVPKENMTLVAILKSDYFQRIYQPLA